VVLECLYIVQYTIKDHTFLSHFRCFMRSLTYKLTRLLTHSLTLSYTHTLKHPHTRNVSEITSVCFVEHYTTFTSPSLSSSPSPSPSPSLSPSPSISQKLELFETEIELLGALHHPYIGKCVDSYICDAVDSKVKSE
jgi:hypothetical protein